MHGASVDCENVNIWVCSNLGFTSLDLSIPGSIIPQSTSSPYVILHNIMLTVYGRRGGGGKILERNKRGSLVKVP